MAAPIESTDPNDYDVVISGMSGRFPECDNIEEFKKNLFDGVDLVTANDKRWAKGLYGLPERTGTLKDIEHFDASFFGISNKQANSMDPMMRILLEITFEAIVDSGINPEEIRGSKTGVFIALSSSESEEYFSQDPENVTGYDLLGSCRSMYPNRISYHFDFTGPSYVIDTACSSSLYALEQAFSAMKDGKCDSAIVGGVNILLKSATSAQLQKLGMLSPEGKCKSFDASGDGYVRSEAAVVLFLQKGCDARRLYATIINACSNTVGNKELEIIAPSGEMQKQVMLEVYEKSKIDPKDVAYVEAHGPGTKIGDPQEGNAIVDVFCKNRSTPLLIGSVKSNMGHSEAAAGLCSIVKVIISMETNQIPKNLHYTTANTNIPGLVNGKLQVVQNNTPLNGNLVAVNSIGFGGTNAHVLLKINPKEKSVKPNNTDVPRVVGVSGRSTEAVVAFLTDIQSNVNDDELLSLIQKTYLSNIPNHDYRGYIINKQSCVTNKVQLGKKEIWYIFSGIGTQWPNMGKSLMNINICRSTLEKCASILKPFGINLIELLTNATETMTKDIVNSFVSIVSIQIALTDLLTTLGLEPDGMIGHSLGELGCAYTDGTLTIEQTVLSAYWRGRSIKDCNLAPGAMAVVGLSQKECKKECPESIDIACHNNDDNVTISGPQTDINELVTKLSANKIFAKVIESNNIAFHSKYMHQVGEKLRRALDKIIKSPKLRSRKWISSSVLETKKNPLLKYSSPAYFVNNLLSPVVFAEATENIPANSIVIEISPDSIFQSIIKTPNITYIGLLKNNEQNLEYLFDNIGKIYNAGMQINFSKLYPEVKYPVSRGTPMTASLVRWDHSEKWEVPDFKIKPLGNTNVAIDINDDKNSFLQGHVIDGRHLYPISGYLVLVWQEFAKLRNINYQNLSVVFEEVTFSEAIIMPKKDAVKFTVSILQGAGTFEVRESDTIIVTGSIRVPNNVDKEFSSTSSSVPENAGPLDMKTADIYKDLHLRGYDYDGLFKGILAMDQRAVFGELEWKDNYTSFIDTMLQLLILGMDSRDMFLPTFLQKAVINPILHQKQFEEKNENKLSVHVNPDTAIVKSGGIEMCGIKVNLTSRNPPSHSPPILEKYIFIPCENEKPLDENPTKANIDALTTLLQIVLENSDGDINLKIAEITHQNSVDKLCAKNIANIYKSEPLVYADIIVYTEVENNFNETLDPLGIKVIKKNVETEFNKKDLHLIVVNSALTGNEVEKIIKSIKEGGFILIEETVLEESSLFLQHESLVFVAKQTGGTTTFNLIRKYKKNPNQNKIINITDSNFLWLELLKQALKEDESTNVIYLVGTGEEMLGLQGLFNCIKREVKRKNVISVFIQDKNVEPFSLTSPVYSEHLNKNLTCNVLKNGVWGTFRHIQLDKITDKRIQTEHAYINTLIKGDLNSLTWIEGPLSLYDKNQSNRGNELCYVYYSSLNFRDKILASGKYPQDLLLDDLAGQENIFGMEFAGKDRRGKRKMGFAKTRCLATTVLTDSRLLWDVDENWSLEEAATVPVAYSTGYYALVMRAQIKKGASVLIHSGATDIGQAAITIAQDVECIVYTTVDLKDNTEKEFIIKNFQIPECNIGNSRDTSFEQLILNQTKGRGVDVVFNTLSKQKFQASVRCLAHNGHFLEVGKYNSSINATLGMSVFLKNITFHGISLNSLFDNDNSDTNKLHNLIYGGIVTRVVKPLTTKIFNDDQISEAFEYMEAKPRIDKILLKIRDEESPGVKPVPRFINAIPRTYIKSEKCYVICGGLGGLGLELTNWLIKRGATKIVITSRNGISTGYQKDCIARWKKMKVSVNVVTIDASTIEGAQDLIEEAASLGPVGGIFNLAAVLSDALIENQTEETFKIPAKPKIDITKCLDNTSKELCPLLEHFVVFSSVSSGRGNAGQTNYGMANSAMERICEARQREGLPGLAIQWGAIGDTGLTYEIIGKNNLEVGGTLPQSMTSFLQTIDYFMKLPHPVVASMVVAEKEKPEPEPEKPNLLDEIAKILGLKNFNDSADSTKLVSLGMNSMMRTEIKQLLERDYKIKLSDEEIQNLTIGDLRKLNEQANTIK